MIKFYRNVIKVSIPFLNIGMFIHWTDIQISHSNKRTEKIDWILLLFPFAFSFLLDDKCYSFNVFKKLWFDVR